MRTPYAQAPLGIDVRGWCGLSEGIADHGEVRLCRLQIPVHVEALWGRATNLAPRPAEGYFRQHAPIVLCGMSAKVRIRRDQAYPIFHALNGWIVSAQKVNGLYHQFSQAEADGNKDKNDGAGGEDGSRSIG